MNSDQIKKLFSDIVTQTSKISPAFMNWSEIAIDEAVQKYKFVFLKTDSDELCSMICYQCNSEFTEILALGTAEQFQKQGRSEKLLLQFLSDCGAMSKLITLEVHAKNDRAIALYQKCGFKTVRIRKKYYSDGSDALVMDFRAD